MNDVKCSVAVLFLFNFLFASISQAGNEFEELIRLKMPEIREAYFKIPEVREKYLQRIDDARKELSKFQTIELAPGVVSPVFLPGINQLNEIQRYHYLNSEIDHLNKTIDHLKWQVMLDFAVPLIKSYSWAIPNDSVIDRISKYSPLIEIGAGSGYWAKLLRDHGADIVAYDNKEAKYYEKYWLDVEIGDEKIVSKYTNRTLMLCWPPKWNEMALNALNNYEGQNIIFIGEIKDGAATGTEAFFKALEQRFELLEIMDIENWPGYSDQVYIFKRRKSGPEFWPF